jgi:hypothetical protein
MVMASYNFNGLKDNTLLSFYTIGLDKNFRTFHKGDPHKFDLDLNFLNKKQNEHSWLSNTHLDRHLPVKNKTSDTKLLKPNIDIYRVDGENRSNSPKIIKRLEPLKKTNSIIF